MDRAGRLRRHEAPELQILVPMAGAGQGVFDRSSGRFRCPGDHVSRRGARPSGSIHSRGNPLLWNVPRACCVLARGAELRPACLPLSGLGHRVRFLSEDGARRRHHRQLPNANSVPVSDRDTKSFTGGDAVTVGGDEVGQQDHALTRRISVANTNANEVAVAHRFSITGYFADGHRFTHRVTVAYLLAHRIPVVHCVAIRGSDRFDNGEPHEMGISIAQRPCIGVGECFADWQDEAEQLTQPARLPIRLGARAHGRRDANAADKHSDSHADAGPFRHAHASDWHKHVKFVADTGIHGVGDRDVDRDLHLDPKCDSTFKRDSNDHCLGHHHTVSSDSLTGSRTTTPTGASE